MKSKKPTIAEKFKKDEPAFTRIKNEDLVCVDCEKRYDDTDLPCNTSKCEAYDVKPYNVLDGDLCDEYSEER